MEKERMIEVLAPAGSFESMKAAVNAGADAVYMGGTRFGARAYAENPETDQLLEAIDYVHLHGKKLYLTVNTLLKERELSEELYEFLAPVYEAGVDALIIQDFGVWRAVRRWFPDLPLHASTQMTITGVSGAREAKRWGASRIVTARELSIEEIRRIHEQVDIEIEAFVHGALCYSYSGQCLFSSLAGGRSGNRGRCAGICRLPYEGWEGERRCTDPAAPYLLNLKDLCALDSLGELLDAGVCSLKIEGRMKPPRYAAGVVSIYRKYVDLYKKVGGKCWKAAGKDKEFLLGLFDRGGFSDGYFHVHNGETKRMFTLSEKPFRKPDASLMEQLDRIYVEPEKKEKIKGTIRITKDLPAKLSLNMDHVFVSAEGGMVLPAKTRPLTEADIKKQIEKFGDTPFVLEELKVELSEHSFLPVGALNELRRSAVSSLKKEILKKYRREGRPLEESPETVPEGFLPGGRPEPGAPVFSVLAEEEPQFLAAVREPSVKRIYLSVENMEPGRLSELLEDCKAAGKECFLALPRIWRDGDKTWFLDSAIIKHVDGFLIRVLDEFFLLDQFSSDIKAFGGSYEFVADASLYTMNKEARNALFLRGFSMDTAPFELNGKELLKDRGISGSEIVVYGRLPMMVSAQCIRKTVRSCGKGKENPNGSRKGKPLFISDRKRFRFPVKQYCRFCYNVIYNHAPLWLAEELSAIAAMEPAMLRLQFTTEGEEEASSVIRAYAMAFEGKPYEYQPEAWTRGHYRRGVE